jgi:hypothetical protein
MIKNQLKLTALIHDRLSNVMNFVYARKPLEKMVSERFSGNWMYLNKSLFDVSEEKAIQSLLELALFFRILDDEEQINSKLKNQNFDCGVLHTKVDGQKSLDARSVANKIIHSEYFDFDLDYLPEPVIRCHCSDPREKWMLAEIELYKFAGLCALLAS